MNAEIRKSGSVYAKLSLFAVIIGGAMGLLALLWVKQTPPAPDVSFVSLNNGNQGQEIRLQELKGKLVLVNFWATSCVTCVAEMPKMIETYNKYHPQGYEMVAVAMSYDRPDYVINFMRTRQLPFMVTLDTEGKLAKSFGEVNLTPTSFLIDKQGRIIRRYLGEPDFTQFHALLERELKS